MEVISPTLEAEYLRRYSELPHRNITFQMFMSTCERKKKEKDEWSKLFQERIRRGCLNFEVDLKIKPSPDSIQRTIVIDGANIMHCGSRDFDTRTGKNQECIPDVLALLAVMRFFVENDFEVIVVISHKYQKDDATNCCVAMRELIRENLCTVSHQTNLDDVIALEFAAHVNGVVVTSDYYIDHQCQSDRYKSMCYMNWIGIDWRTIGVDKNTLTSDGRHFLSSRRFFFKNQNKTVLNEIAVKQKVFSDTSDPRYVILKERRETSWTSKRREEVLTVLNRLIVEGIATCPSNVQRILATPLRSSQPKDEETLSDFELTEEW